MDIYLFPLTAVIMFCLIRGLYILIKDRHTYCCSVRYLAKAMLTCTTFVCLVHEASTIYLYFKYGVLAVQITDHIVMSLMSISLLLLTKMNRPHPTLL